MPRFVPLLRYSGRSSRVDLVPGGQITRACGMAVAPPLASRQTA